MQVPGLRWLLDAYQLWMAGRGALVGFALVGSRPPLHVAVPFQLLGLWRVHAADFCRANILQHPTMRRRTGKSACWATEAAMGRARPKVAPATCNRGSLAPA